MSGIVLGDGKNIPYYINTQLKDTSTIHMVVVSGQNLAILAGFLMSLVYFLGRKKTVILTSVILILYTFLTGAGVLVIRSAVMVMFAFLGQLLGKESRSSWLLIITTGLMLLYNPNWIISVSFQLSFVAAFAVVVVAPCLSLFLQRIPNVLQEDLAATISATLSTLPIIAYHFGRVSLLGVLANLLVLWTIPLIMISGVFSLIVGLCNLFLGQVLAVFPAILLTYFLNIVNFFAHLPISTSSIGSTNMYLWLGYYLILLALYLVLNSISKTNQDK